MSQNLFVVLGMHRSGTSAIARSLTTMGLNLGDHLMPPVSGVNEKGFWEDIDVNSLNIDIQSFLDSDWHFLSMLSTADVENLTAAGFVSRACDLLRTKIASFPNFGLKDPRITKLLPFWKKVFDQLGCQVFYIIAIRNPISVAASLHRRDEIPTKKSLSLWLEHTLLALSETRSKRCVVIDYDRLILAPESELLRLAQHLGLRLDEKLVSEYLVDFLDKNLRHSHTDYKATPEDDDFECLVKRTYSLALKAASDEEDASDISFSDEVEQIFSEFRKYVYLSIFIEKDNSYVALLSEKVRGLDSELAARDSELAARAQDLIRSQSRIAELEQSTSWRVTHPLRRMVDLTRQAHSRTAAARRLVALLSEKVRTRDIEIAASAKDLVRSQGRVAELEQSTSWRVTKPLRRVVDLTRQAHSRTSAARRLWRRAWTSLPMVWRILRTEGPFALARRIRNKLNAPRYVAPRRPASALSPIGPLALPTCAEGLVPRYSIVIPVYAQHLHTFNCLKSLGEHTALSDVEIIVVDDASPTEAAGALSNLTGVRLVRNVENLGFIGSCHHGADLARGQMLVMLNNDTQVTAGWLSALQAVFDQRKDAGLVGARLVYPDGSLQEAGGIVWQDGSAWNWGRGDDPDRPIYTYLREADYCSGACVAIRRDDWVTLGGFDGAYKPAYYEDTDLAFRVRESGKRVYYQPQCTIVHFEGISSGTDETTGVKRHQVVNREVFKNRWKATLQSHRLNGVDANREVDRTATARVLIVEACMITPDHDSGSVRMLAMLELLLEQGCKVSFVADNLEYRQPYVAQLQGMGVEVWFAPYVTSVEQLLKERGKLYDTIVFCRHYIAAPYVQDVRKWAPQARIVFDTVDLHYLREQRLAELDNSSALLATSAKTREQELGVVEACDTTLVVSPVEQGILLKELPAADVRVLSNIHEVQPSGLGFAQRDGLLFIGGFRHLPNLDAIEWFVAEVWPLVRARLPALTLTVVGSLMPDRIKAINGPGINNLGYVADVESLIARARISLAPMRYGAGVKGKVNQAMAHGLPVVATSVSAEGMGLRPGIDLLVADEPQAFADAIVRLHGDEALWQSLAENGRANVERHFSRANASAMLAELVGLQGLATSRA